ncbi:ElyC/SanA/YdcF family protein [Ochrobactrum sp. GPK 3]|uniref:YdcF family protein n=1 Tax=Brucella sp. 22210 TaxID=3453892 RepID=UPI0031385959
MTALLIIVFLILGLLSLYFNWHKLGITLVGLSVILYAMIASAILPEYLLDRLQSPYTSSLPTPLEDNTAFILFGIGTQTINERDRQAVEPLAFSYGPIFAAASMNHQCVQMALKCNFLISGADVAGTGVPEAVSIAQELEKVGIMQDSIILDRDSRNSWQNAKRTAAVLRNLKPGKVILLQAAPMMKRDLLYLSHFGVVAEPIAAGYLTTAHTNMFSIGINLLATDLALHEEIGIWRYALYNYLGWNEPKQPMSLPEKA